MTDALLGAADAELRLRLRLSDHMTSGSARRFSYTVDASMARYDIELGRQPIDLTDQDTDALVDYANHLERLPTRCVGSYLAGRSGAPERCRAYVREYGHDLCRNHRIKHP